MAATTTRTAVTDFNSIPALQDYWDLTSAKANQTSAALPMFKVGFAAARLRDPQPLAQAQKSSCGPCHFIKQK